MKTSKKQIPKKLFTLPRKGSINGMDGIRRNFWIVDEITRQVSVNVKGTSKIICFQKAKWDDGRIEYRLTYYMLGIKTRRWIFGQYSLMVPPRILGFLLKEARKRKWQGL